jgi:hypothetical protein
VHHLAFPELIAWCTALILISVATMAAMARTQPWQNVIAATAWMCVLSSVVLLILPNVAMAVPRWAVPVLWTNVVLNSRGVAKLVLRRWRSNEYYGFWLIGVASVLSIVALLPWRPNVAALGVAFGVAAVLQILSIPWLVEKRPVVPPLNWWPLTIWISLITASFVYARWHATQ